MTDNPMEDKTGLHTILGAGGSVGNALTRELLDRNERVRLISRSKFSWPGAESVRGDVTSLSSTIEAVKGSDIVYLCVGLPYETKVWQELWPKVISNAIEACKVNNARLIFFDNVYMYGKVDGKMTEDTPYNPCSRKGEIRANVARQLEHEMRQGNLSAIIARAADLYGPYATRSSIPYLLVIDRLRKGHKAQWMVNPNSVHSCSYTLDCARGLLLLAAHTESFNQTWHLPTKNPPISGKAFIEIVAKELGVEPRYSVLKKWMLRLAGLGNSTIREVYEMLYQFEFDYYFDSSKFERHFNYTPTSYSEGIAETIRFLQQEGASRQK
ncbi:MAG: NAD-dependent epimerase/dehydratase family protein [Bacteroidota bacterium]